MHKTRQVLFAEAPILLLFYEYRKVFGKLVAATAFMVKVMNV